MARQKIWAPHLKRHVIIGGCKLPSRHAPMLKMSKFVSAAALSAAPVSCDYTAKAMSVIRDVEGNDAVGDCVEAEDAHYIGVITGNANQLFTYTAARTLQDYSDITGFNPSDPNTDQGTDPIAAMQYRVTHGYADGSKDLGFLQVDATSKAEVMYALANFGNLKIWLGLPDSYVSPFPSTDGVIWDIDTPDPNNGHCIGAAAYDSPLIVGSNCDGVQVLTWGLILTMTWNALAALCVPSAGGGGMATRVNWDWLGKAIGKTPSGLDAVGLIQAFDALGGTIPIPQPGPGPIPVPPPSGGPPTLAQAQSAVAGAIKRPGVFPLMTQQQAIDDANAGLAALTGWPS